MTETTYGRDFLERMLPYQNLETPIWIFDTHDIKIVWANASALSLWAAANIEELQSRNLLEGAVQTSLDYLQSLTKSLEAGQRVREDWTIFPNNKPVRCQVAYTTTPLPDGRPGLRIECIALESAVPSDNARTIEALRHTTAMISSYTRDFEEIYANPAAKRAASNLTFRERFLRPRRFQQLEQLLAKKDFASIVARIRNGSVYAWHNIQVQRCQDPLTGEPGYLVSETNISREREAKLQANTMAFTDKLTELPNQNYLELSLANSLAKHQKTDKPIAAIGISLDQLRTINTIFGREVGNSAIRQIARILQSEVQQKDLLVRSNADEFMIVRTDVASYQSLILLARRVIRTFTNPVTVDGQDIKFTPSLGIAVYPHDAHDAPELLQSVDIAIDHTKLAGGNNYYLFDATMKQQLEYKQRLKSDLRAAIDNNQLELHYQPRFGKSGDFVTGAEALIRWNHPLFGQLKPGDFIPIAEESGLIHDIDDWVLDAGCKQLAKWSKSGYKLRLSLNLSASQFNNAHFVAKLDKTLTETGCKSHNLELEITESMLINDIDSTSQILESIHQMGVAIAIDDFGTGYSNLAYLQSFPIDYLKIDRTFVANIDQSAILEMIISLGKMLGVTLVAEGVETPRQLAWLTNRGCNEFQGYYLGRPVPLDVFEENFIQPYQPAPRISQHHAA